MDTGVAEGCRYDACHEGCVRTRFCHSYDHSDVSHITPPQKNDGSLQFTERAYNYDHPAVSPFLLTQATKPTNREVFDYPCNRNELATFLRARGWRVRSGSGAGFLDDSQLLSNLQRHFNKLGKKFSASKWNGPFFGERLEWVGIAHQSSSAATPSTSTTATAVTAAVVTSSAPTTATAPTDAGDTATTPALPEPPPQAAAQTVGAPATGSSTTTTTATATAGASHPTPAVAAVATRATDSVEFLQRRIGFLEEQNARNEHKFTTLLRAADEQNARNEHKFATLLRAADERHAASLAAASEEMAAARSAAEASKKAAFATAFEAAGAEMAALRSAAEADKASALAATDEENRASLRAADESKAAALAAARDEAATKAQNYAAEISALKDKYRGLRSSHLRAKENAERRERGYHAERYELSEKVASLTVQLEHARATMARCVRYKPLRPDGPATSPY